MRELRSWAGVFGVCVGARRVRDGPTARHEPRCIGMDLFMIDG
ncbi:hypothetical protein [Streptomyces sp. NPDC001508]